MKTAALAGAHRHSSAYPAQRFSCAYDSSPENKQPSVPVSADADFGTSGDTSAPADAGRESQGLTENDEQGSVHEASPDMAN